MVLFFELHSEVECVGDLGAESDTFDGHFALEVVGVLGGVGVCEVVDLEFLEGYVGEEGDVYDGVGCLLEDEVDEGFEFQSEELG